MAVLFFSGLLGTSLSQVKSTSQVAVATKIWYQPSLRAANGAENDPNAGRIFGYFVLIFGYFRANLWLFCRLARSTTATATPHGQEIGFFLPRKIQK